MEEVNSFTVCGVECKYDETLKKFRSIHAWSGKSPNGKLIQIFHLPKWKKQWVISCFCSGVFLGDPIAGDNPEDIIKEFELRFNQSSF
jgi:hypothetical protein